jgi:exonuclease SbcC
MLLKKIRLENIRSYINQEINFPLGSTLLSGDIGSGKTSILLAIEFALFGLRRGELSGHALLRNGTQKGSVELHFEIDNKNIVIKRTLKREKNYVTQDTGWIMINNIKKEMSAIELKQTILTLFNYPKELLTKSKSLIYKYTIYTPQEEMKQILLADKEARLDTLRKVFGIDKYKRINQNLEIFIKYLKTEIKVLDLKTEDIYQKIQEKEQALEKSNNLKAQTQNLNIQISTIENEISNLKQNLEATEQRIKELNNLKQNLTLTENNILHYQNLKNTNNLKIKDLKNSLESIQIPQETIDIDSIKTRIKDKETDIQNLETKTKSLLLKIHEAEIKITNSENIKNKINTLDTCPTCRQKVAPEHKHKIEENENLIIKQYKEILEEAKNQKQEYEKQISELKSQLEELRKKEQEYNIIKFKIDSLNEKKELLSTLEKEQLELEKKLQESLKKKQELKEKILTYETSETTYKELKEKLETKQNELKKLEIEKAAINQEIKTHLEKIQTLEKEIEEKRNFQKKSDNLKKLKSFLEKEFFALMQTMEKQIMLKVHHDFDSLFQKWFSILITPDIIQIKLDYEFTPLIIQNGHDIDYINLSGGEKTAIALSYRLALNQTINKLMSKIKTKDIIILDEPTDGFSSEQLDKIRLIFDELEVKQLIIVSHEAKIESFVENIIRLSKQDHVTQII